MLCWIRSGSAGLFRAGSEPLEARRGAKLSSSGILIPLPPFGMRSPPLQRRQNPRDNPLSPYLTHQQSQWECQDQQRAGGNDTQDTVVTHQMYLTELSVLDFFHLAGVLNWWCLSLLVPSDLALMNWIRLIASTSKAQNPNIHRRSGLEEKTDRYKVDVTGFEQWLYLQYIRLCSSICCSYTTCLW